MATVKLSPAAKLSLPVPIRETASSAASPVRPPVTVKVPAAGAVVASAAVKPNLSFSEPVFAVAALVPKPICRSVGPAMASLPSAPTDRVTPRSRMPELVWALAMNWSTVVVESKETSNATS